MKSHDKASIVFIVMILVFLAIAPGMVHAQDGTTQTLYFPTVARSAQMGTVIGTLYCRSTNQPLPQAHVWFVWEDFSNGWLAIANGNGQFVIHAAVGTVGHLEWEDEILTDDFPFTSGVRVIIVYAGC